MPIISGALILQRRSTDPELAKATARIIERQARLLGRLVDDLLDGGLGIGFYLARRFVEAHGGTLIATSAGVGAGSSFTIRIPCPGFAPEAAGVPQWDPSSRSVSALTTA